MCWRSHGRIASLTCAAGRSSYHVPPCRRAGRLVFHDLCFQVDHEASDRVQEVHQLAYHLICDRIERGFT